MAVTFVGVTDDISGGLADNGAWIGKIGSLGYWLAMGENSIPSDVTAFALDRAGYYDYGSSKPTRELQIPSAPSTRSSAIMYSNDYFYYDLTFVVPLRITVHYADWDEWGRTHVSTWWDATRTTAYDQRIVGPGYPTYGNYIFGGLYMTWDIDAGSYSLESTRLGPQNVDSCGMFFDTVPSVVATPKPFRISLNQAVNRASTY